MFPTIEKLKKLTGRKHAGLPSNVIYETSPNSMKNTIGFLFKKPTKRTVHMESLAASAASCHPLLRRIRYSREDTYKIFYTDESWCGQNHTVAHAWQKNIPEVLNYGYMNY